MNENTMNAVSVISFCICVVMCFGIMASCEKEVSKVAGKSHADRIVGDIK